MHNFLLYNYISKISDFNARNHKSNKATIFFHLVIALYRLIIARYFLRNCTKVGHYVSVNHKPKIKNNGTIILSDDVRIWSNVVQSQIYVSKGGILEVGKNSRLNGVHIDAKNKVVIGKNVRIAPEVLIMDSDFHSIEDHFADGKVSPIFIDDDVWIASKSIILKGVTIGKGAVVATGSVVTRNVAPYTMVGGVPARLIKRIEGGAVKNLGFESPRSA